MAHQQNATEGLRELSLFSGAGGSVLGGKLLGWRTVCAVELNEHCRKSLMQRQDDGCFEPFPIWDEIRSFDGKPWRGLVDVVSGGFPCQDISAARSNSKDNGKAKGLYGKSSGLWCEMRRVISEVQPGFAIIENSPLLRTRGLVIVLRDLAEMGYDAKWGVLGVRGFGADHIRERIFIIATNANLSQLERRRVSSGIHPEHSHIIRTDWWKSEPGLERVAHGMADWSKRLIAVGNGQIPAVVRLAWNCLTQE